MPVPATKGQLRTAVADMKIGDYIGCNYTATSGAVGTFSGLGSPSGSEIPVAGAAAPNGYFYLLKAARGLLIADRVIQNTISWDTLNASSLIEGVKSLDTFKAIRDFQSNALGSQQGVSGGTVTVNGVNDVTLTPTTQGVFAQSDRTLYTRSLGKVFISFEVDPITRSALSTAYNTHILVALTKISQMTLGFAIREDGIYTWGNSITETLLIPGKAWTKFTLYYDDTTNIATVLLDDNLAWTGAIQYAASNWGSTTAHTVFLAVKSSITARFKLNNVAVDVANTTRNVVPFAPGGHIRSLIGGIIIAGINGGTTTTAPPVDFGMLPVANEYDTYIRQSSLGGKIKAGDDNVWHTSGCLSWVQETTPYGVFTNRAGATTPSFTGAYRNLRGTIPTTAAAWGSWAADLSSVASVNYGFRPVFQYTE